MEDMWAERINPLRDILNAYRVTGRWRRQGLTMLVAVLSFANGSQNRWVSIWPQRALRKHEAASFLQRLTRGANGRRRYRHEKSRYATVQKMIKRARNRHMCQAWNTFVQNARQLIREFVVDGRNLRNLRSLVRMMVEEPIFSSVSPLIPPRSPSFVLVGPSSDTSGLRRVSTALFSSAEKHHALCIRRL